MYYYIEGIITHIETNAAVIDCGGVGYFLRVSLRTQGLIRRGEKVKLYTYLNVREDTFELYGFYDTEEKNCFLHLIGISGVGVRAAQSILSTLSPDQVVLAILNSDDKMLTQSPGIGKKLAQRIILELGDKLKKEYKDSGLPAETAAGIGSGQVRDEARMALMALGYSSAEASAALRTVSQEGQTLEETIRAALKGLVREP